MAKDLQDEQYKIQLREFMAVVNPKPSMETLEKLKQEYMERRKKSQEGV